MTYYSRSRQVVQVPLDKLLFVIASLYFGLTVTWIFTHQKAKPISIASTNTNISSANQEVVASVPTTESKIVTPPVAKPTPKQIPIPPVVKVASPLPPPPPVMTPPASPVERIYIPVYPQNPSFTPDKPKKVAPTAVKIPPPPPPVVTVAPSAIPSPPPMQLHKSGGKLVGILELGDRSSALFDTNGATKRATIGENVNGWVVMKIQNQQVFLNRGSTTKVIDIGQSF
ncbi:hypothetical protein [Chroococcus sp. FPU101]|uniref:hypothetical protein n=1 Tax=Chroococcus sp. FPU101 TaxID=1974212 RepID=UPI001A8FF644|nr:hypothetical protein [Chroococcus sp. FPU101]GFE68497.1 hypothetical protein CFPU101_11070 [Chroococcus sp. FPU101]